MQEYIDTLFDTVYKGFGLKKEDVLFKKRTDSVYFSRCYIADKLYQKGMSLKAIGVVINRDHSTVHNMLRKYPSILRSIRGRYLAEQLSGEVLYMSKEDKIMLQAAIAFLWDTLHFDIAIKRLTQSISCFSKDELEDYEKNLILSKNNGSRFDIEIRECINKIRKHNEKTNSDSNTNRI